MGYDVIVGPDGENSDSLVIFFEGSFRVSYGHARMKPNERKTISSEYFIMLENAFSEVMLFVLTVRVDALG